MSTTTTQTNLNIGDLPAPDPGPSVEMRRFSAGMRVITALLVTTLFFAYESQAHVLTVALVFSYCLWSAWLLWLEANGRAPQSVLWAYWVDVAWSCLIIKLWSVGAMMMVITLVYPVVLTSVGYGVRHGLLLALLASLGMLLAKRGDLTVASVFAWQQNIMLLLLLALVPAAALIARPMGVRFRWFSLLVEIQAQLDPRRGLKPLCSDLVERLRLATQADVVALVLPSRLGAPAMLASRDDGSFSATAAVHAHLERLLARLPVCLINHVQRPWWDPRPKTRLHARLPLPANLASSLAELEQTLDVRNLSLVPLTRYGHQHGHLVIGYSSKRNTVLDLLALAQAAPELLRSIEQASLVDRLQEESASHERARIGRDLHDSAIQPYLGLKYAVEALALRIPVDNPVRAEVDSLAELVNSEVFALRELISGLRTGDDRGDNALVPAIRRQVRRFSILFGVDVEMDCPDTLPTTRAMASALFHMVNEVLNNIRKHTVARHIWISLSVQDGLIRLVVRDDAGSRLGRSLGHFHPVSLSERTAELHGTLDISCPDGLNTTLVIQIPLKQS